MARTLTLDSGLSSDRKPVKVDGESTGLLVAKNKVYAEGQLEADSLNILRDFFS